MARQPSVLIVDQDPNKRAELQKRLGRRQFVVVGVCGYGAEAMSLAQQTSPDIILLALEEPLVRPLQTMEALVAALPDVPIVTYSSTEDAASARRAVLAGARDFLTKPLKTEELTQSIYTVLEQEEKRRMYRAGKLQDDVAPGVVITVFGTKGGIGKTTVSTNLAIALAQITRGSVALVDIDTHFGDVGLVMDVDVGRNVAELGQRIDHVDRDSIRKYLVTHPTGVRILPAPLRPTDWLSVTANQLEKILRLLAQTHDFVVLDTPGTFNELMATALDMSTVVLALTSLDMASIKDTVVGMEMLRAAEFPQERVKLTVSRSSSANTVRGEDLEVALKQKVFWHVPFDYEVTKAAQAGKPVVLARPRSKAAQSIFRLAVALSGDKTAVREASATRPLRRLFQRG